ncbi:MAG: HEAT repeat domain-containing protein [Anaerolineae bacterium]|nr:HEAT repeat domain-containing protein [Anaerolineae bacterium]
MPLQDVINLTDLLTITKSEKEWEGKRLLTSAGLQANYDVLAPHTDLIFEPLRNVLLHHPSHVNRSDAARILGNIKLPAAVPILSAAAKNDDDHWVRQCALYALWIIGQPTATTLLTSILQWTVDDLPPYSYGRKREPERADYELHELKSVALLAIHSAHDRSAIPALIQALDGDHWLSLYSQLCDTIREITDEESATEIYFTLLEHPNSVVRGMSARGLGFVATASKDERLRSIIVWRLLMCWKDIGNSHHFGGTVAGEAARSMGFIGTPLARAASHAWRDRQKEQKSGLA